MAKNSKTASSNVRSKVNEKRAKTSNALPVNNAQATNAPATPSPEKAPATNTPPTKTPKTNSSATPKPVVVNQGSNSPEIEEPSTEKKTQQTESIVVNEQEDSQEKQNQNTLGEAPAPTNSGNRTYRTDDDFLGLSEEKQKEYLDGLGDNNVEREHLLGLLKDKQKEKEKERKDHEDETASIEQTDIDEGVRGSDEEVKAEKGDIIEWMMEKIILKGLEKAGDFVIDEAMYFTYGAGHIIYREGRKITDPVSEYLDKKDLEIRKKLYDFVHGTGKKPDQGSTPPPSPNQPTSTPPNQDDPQPSNPDSGEENNLTLDELINILEEDKKNHYIPDAEEIKNEIKFKENMLRGIIALEDDGYIKNGKKFKFPDYGKKYSNKDIKSYFETCKKAAVAEASVYFLKSIDPDEKLDKEVRKDLETWMNNTINGNEEKTRTGKDVNHEFPESLKNRGYTEDSLNQHLEKAINQTSVIDKACAYASNLQANTEYFACNYAIYKLIEMARCPKDEEELKRVGDPKELAKLGRQLFAEGQNIMLHNYEALRNSDKTAVSEEEMLQLSDEMFNTSKNLYKNRDTRSSSPNLIEERIKAQKPASEELTLDNYVDSLSINDVISIYRNNLNALKDVEEKLNGKQAENDSKRSYIEAMKERIKAYNRNSQKKQLGHMRTQAEKLGIDTLQNVKGAYLGLSKNKEKE